MPCFRGHRSRLMAPRKCPANNANIRVASRKVNIVAHGCFGPSVFFYSVLIFGGDRLWWTLLCVAMLSYVVGCCRLLSVLLRVVAGFSKASEWVIASFILQCVYLRVFGGYQEFVFCIYILSTVLHIVHISFL